MAVGLAQVRRIAAELPLVGSVVGDGRGRRATSVCQRLALLVLAPTLGVAAFGYAAFVDRSDAAREAEDIEALIAEATEILDVKVLLADESSGTGSLLAARIFGVEPMAGVLLSGYDQLPPIRSAREAVDAATTGRPHLSAAAKRIRNVRSMVDTGQTDFAATLSRYSVVQDRLTELASSALRKAEIVAAGVGHSTSLRHDMATLLAAAEVKTALSDEQDALLRALGPGRAPDVPELLELRRAALAHADAAARLDGLAGGSLRRLWRDINEAEGARWFAGEVARHSATPPDELPQLEGPALVQHVVKSMDSVQLHDPVVELAEEETTGSAQALRERAERAVRLVVGIAVFIALLVALLTSVVARSIVQPIQALAQRAARATMAGPNEDDGRHRGPREVVEAAASFDELVENLRVVESQLSALSVGALGDPVLEVPVPGRMGHLLHDSVLRLSRSITERELLAHRLEREVTHDALTGLPNRASLVAHLQESLDDDLLNHHAALLIVDLDGFKPVNDTHGHDAGDRLLEVIAGRLRSHLGPGDVAARIGGDEFAVLVRDCTAEEATEMARLLVTHVGAPTRIGAVVIRVRASAGVSVAEPGLLPEAMLRHASLAATVAKAAGGGNVERFDPTMLADVLRRADVEERLRQGLAAGDLLLHFQPVVDASMEPDGLEALIRWRQSDGSLLEPDHFIPVAEASDLIVDIGRWVLDEACGRLAAWTDDPKLGRLHLSVNVSARHVLSLSLVEDVRRALADSGVDPRRLGVEVTETMVLSDLPLAKHHLGQLQAMGVRVVVDDFGTGYTSLGHLRELPVDVIKLDRSLVVAAALREADARVVELVVAAAHAMGLTVVAEGVETLAQLDLLRLAGCDRFQGFLIARPAPLGVGDVRALAPAPQH